MNSSSRSKTPQTGDWTARLEVGITRATAVGFTELRPSLLEVDTVSKGIIRRRRWDLMQQQYLGRLCDPLTFTAFTKPQNRMKAWIRAWHKSRAQHVDGLNDHRQQRGNQKVPNYLHLLLHTRRPPSFSDPRVSATATVSIATTSTKQPRQT